MTVFFIAALGGLLCASSVAMPRLAKVPAGAPSRRRW